MSVYVDVKSLPETIQAALRNAGVNRPMVSIKPRETDCVATGAYGDGYQGFTILLDIDSGETSDTFRGSWGGNNPFVANQVDLDDRQRPVPPNACIIHGQRGGGRPASASLVIHPSRAAKLLPAASSDELSPRLKTLLAVYKSYNTRGRAEWFERHGRGTDAEISELAAKGLIKVNKAGAVTVTADGRNAAPKSDCYRGWIGTERD